MDKPKILIVEDDESIRTQMKWALVHAYDIFLVADANAAMELILREHPPLVTLDLGLPPAPEGTSEGLKLLVQILQSAPGTKVIVVTGNPERTAALNAVAIGAYDFFTKPVNIDELKVILRRAFYVYKLEAEYHTLQQQLTPDSFGNMAGVSPCMQEIFATIRKVSTTDVPVLITGESGTGKELAASAIHSHSLRHDKPFIPINCGAIPENLMESELFGHEKGAFTGAHIQRKGRFELAQNGTLFLDEIADLPLSLQVKLLRFLQDHKVERVGGREAIDIDVRVIAATNKDIKKLVEEGKFREDLYYRLAVVTIKLPPLRAREDDILLLAKTFLQRFAINGKGPKSFSHEAIEAINMYAWPGNVRELENKIQRAITFAEGLIITPADLGLTETCEKPGTSFASQALDLKKAKEKLEMKFINAAIRKHNGNISNAAEELG
ncbi:MAG: PEP-CTERM-box response regulator transcription factor, partial [Nitrospinota bacterium]